MKQRSIVALSLGIWGTVVAALTLGKSQLVIGHLWQREAHRTRRLELIPFGEFFHTTPWWGPLTNLLGNVALFVPVGLLLGLLLHRRLHVTALCFATSLFIELAQYMFRLGYSDIDDLIYNTLGGFLGALLVTRLQPRMVIAAILGLSLVLLALLGLGPR